MDGHRFDALIRDFAHRDTARRSALRLAVGSALGLIGWLSAEDADAHNALTKCRKIEDKKKRAKCVKAAKKHNAKHKDKDPEACRGDADCNDANPCTRSVCNPDTRRCEFPAIGGCCTADDQCNDTNACTGDTCDLATNTCVNQPIADCCTDDAECATANPCTLDTCDVATATCVHTVIEGCCRGDSNCASCQRCSAENRCVADANQAGSSCQASGGDGTCCQGACVTCDSGKSVNSTTCQCEDAGPSCDPPCPARQGCAQVACVAGECVILSEPVAAGKTCRPVAGPCDIAETCDGESLDCPPNRFRASTSICNEPYCVRVSENPELYWEFAPSRCTGSSDTCPQPTTHRNCGQHQCRDATSCRTNCDSDSHCVRGAWCDIAYCRQKRDNGVTCHPSRPQQCKSGHCVDDTCCSSASCPPQMNATGTCQSGTCGLSCNEGWGDCNGNLSDGCETETLFAADHCGGCNQVCRGRCGNFGQGNLECIDGSCDCIINP